MINVLLELKCWRVFRETVTEIRVEQAQLVQKSNYFVWNFSINLLSIQHIGKDNPYSHSCLRYLFSQARSEYKWVHDFLMAV